MKKLRKLSKSALFICIYLYVSAQTTNINCIEYGLSRNSSYNREIVALILARGGSKGIPLKNLENINGLSLLGRSISIIKNSYAFADIWVSTDHSLIGAEALLYGANLHYRPDNVSTDHTTSISSVQEFLSMHRDIESVALIQCTSVFMRESYLQMAVELFRDADCVFSVYRSFKLRWRSSSNGQLVPLNFVPQKRPRRQDWNGELLEAGMFYLSRRSLLERGSFQNDRCKYVEVEEIDALEIDTSLDLELARFLVKQLE